MLPAINPVAFKLEAVPMSAWVGIDRFMCGPAGPMPNHSVLRTIKLTMKDQTIVILGGAGAMGALFADTLIKAGASVHIVDSAAVPGKNSLRAAVVPLDAAASRLLARADVAILCLPEAVTLAAFAAVCAALPERALVVDTNSTKLDIADVWKTGVTGPREVLSLNPMFAPGLGWGGQNVAAVALREGPSSAALLRLLEDAGASIETLSAEEHDRVTAGLQVAVHAAILVFGETLYRLGHDVQKCMPLATPPYRTLLALLARISSGQAHVYHDIQERNRYAADARAALAASAETFARKTSLVEFQGSLVRVRAVLGTSQPELTALCTELFEEKPSVKKLSSKRAFCPK